ncbi:4'-phosphopantetheinyl transferase superfamily protein [Aggregicoccus sp. 17bor-14]|uniref:4'-phosphopantetheinyl transferase family protein n=1 Tax=Myxococcaceae TaxID=31 RepID=UPI00129D0808|nr:MULTISPECIES: 4'-phosphopantetheinyl transferase superfamily protein [Myxococcaceae]MBF5042082.1 4'-phosphopantetheinyl transferase superfamily protein [Simulacricoccus sp. 17bor-14]MRI87860.1 4'-phosphopantetheinyl transferase superfamily protein [Aggregicoccus sp. 17bor-14]
MTWTPLAEPALLPALSPERVHLVHLPLVHASELAPREAPLLSEAERVRAGAFAFARDRDRYVLTRGTLRRLLGAALGEPPEALQLVEGEWGKPALAPAHAGPVRFNLSHSGEHALLALAQGRELGVDLERAKDGVDVPGVSRLVFSAEEQRALFALPPERVRVAFFQLWARKEALIKAEGTGFAEPSAQFTLTVDPEQPPRLLAHAARPAAVARWSLCDVALALPGYAAALACEGPPPALSLWRLPLEG